MVDKAIEILKWAIKNGKSLIKACKQFGVSERYLRYVRQEKAKDPRYKEFIDLYNQFKSEKNSAGTDSKFQESEEDFKEGSTFTKNGNEGILDAKGNKHVKTLDSLLAEAKVDLTVWQVEKNVINKWDVTNAEGQTYQNWQVKAWLTKIRTEEETKAWDYFISTINQYSPKYTVVKRSNKVKKYAFELSLPDLHIGKLSWGPESGEDYDTKIAIERYNDAISELINNVEHLKDEIEEIVLPIGNDLFNVDNFRNETTNGTPQHVDSRWQKMFLKAQEMLIYNIDRLRNIAQVKVLMISGNHDTQTVFYLGESLKSWYRNAKDISIDNSPTQRKYYIFGANLIGFTHGNEEKHQDLGLIMATEKPDLWSQTKFRQIHLGHFHKKKETKWIDSDEHQGFKVKVLPSLSGTDSWHASKGYRASKGAVGMIYHKERGMIAEYTFNVC